MLAVDDIIDRIPKLTDLIIKSFVDSRYFDRSYMVTNLDRNEISSDECKNLLSKVDNYYYEKTKISSVKDQYHK